MSGRPILAALLCTSLVALVTAQKPRIPDFSGNWVWVESLVDGATRSGETPAGGYASSVNTSSGAAFNCGRECTLVHKRDTLTVDNARLGGDTGKDPSQKTPAVTFRIDGREAEVVDSFSPHRKLAAAAKWVGNQLEISSGSTPSFSLWTQTLSIEKGHLIVVHARTVNGERHQVRMKYRKK